MKKFALLFAFAFFVCAANAYKIAQKTEDGKPLQGKKAVIVDNNGKVLSGGATRQASASGSAPAQQQNAAQAGAAKPMSNGPAPEAKATATEQKAQEDFAKKSKDIKDQLESIRNNKNNQNKDKDKNKK
ncbi:MAG: hypothetical protein LBL61_04480 [Elusimicrobiota bacterium]|jgi:hypothetical protein|nr:hypothetical protein [Elusimicrobiota bacterium]